MPRDKRQRFDLYMTPGLQEAIDALKARLPDHTPQELITLAVLTGVEALLLPRWAPVVRRGRRDAWRMQPAPGAERTGTPHPARPIPSE